MLFTGLPHHLFRFRFQHGEDAKDADTILNLENVTFPRYCGQSEKLLQQSTEDCHGIKEKTIYARI